MEKSKNITEMYAEIRSIQRQMGHLVNRLDIILAGIPEDELHFDGLNASFRLINCLDSIGIRTVKDLRSYCNVTPGGSLILSPLLNTPNFGRKVLNELGYILRDINVKYVAD